MSSTSDPLAGGRRVAIVGAALSDCGRVDHKTVYELHYQATTRALADAGLTRADIEGFMSTGTGTLAPIEVCDYLGIRPRWVEGTNVGGSAWQFMVEHAVAAIARGYVDVVAITYGSTTRSDLKKGLRTANLTFGGRGAEQFDVPYGHTLISRYAMAAMRHMHEYGTTIEQLAEIAVSTRYNASLNPEAMYRELITIDDVQSSPMMADPLTKLHCCLRSDGGGSVILASEDRARDCAKAPVWILGTGEAISHTTMSEWTDFTESPCVRSGEQAFRRAGVTPADIDVCQLYDSFTPTVLLTLEGLGFCAKGEGGPFVEDGKLRVGGSLPTNTDGGGLSACHPGMPRHVPLGRGGAPAQGRMRAPAGRGRRAGVCQRDRWLVLVGRHGHPGERARLAMTTPSEPALAGLRVVDLSVGIAGAYCTKLFVDAGADVVVVEPPGGHPLRARGGAGALFGFLHTGKRSVIADPAEPPLSGPTASLVAAADIVVIDAAPPDRTAASLAQTRPDLIVVSLSPFGLAGPWSERVASDLTLQALCSSIAGRGERHGSPVTAGGELVEWASGTGAAVATLVALRRRDRTGLGELIDLAALEVAITIFNGFRAVSGQLVPAGPPPYQVVEVPSIEPAQDGWIGFATLSADQFANFAAMIDRPEWAEDPEISRIDVRIDRAAEIRRDIAAWTTHHTVEDIMDRAAARPRAGRPTR